MYDELKSRLTGCFYTIFTPFHDDESIDYESLEKYLSLLYTQGARKFYAMAYNSRYSQLNDSEIFELNEFCIRTIKGLDSENIVVVGDPIHCSTRNTIEFAKHAEDAGADLISLIVREKYFDDAQILEHFISVSNASNIPILVHEMPFLSGLNGKQMHWPRSLMMSLPKIPKIVALKEDAHDFELTRMALELEPKIRVIVAGTKRELMRYQSFGVQAYLNGISIINARIGQEFWKAFKEHDKETIDFILNTIEYPFFNKCAQKYGWHRTNKALLQAAGYMHRRDRMPLKHLSDIEFSLVQTVYSEIQAAWDHKYGNNQ